MGWLDKFLTLTINMQIRIGILFVILLVIIISIILLIMSCLIQFYLFTNSFENIIEENDNKMLSNYEQYIHIIESTIEAKTKSDLEFYKNLEKTFFENLEGLELTALLNENIPIKQIYEYNDSEIKDTIEEKCYDKDYLKCIIYKFYGNEDELKDNKKNENFKNMLNYYNLIFPLINSTLCENSVGMYKLKQYHNFQFYKKIYSGDGLIGKILFFAGTKETPFDVKYSEIQYNNTLQLNILDNLLNLFLVIPNINNKLTLKYILSHFNSDFSSIPQISSNKHILQYDANVPYKTNGKKEMANIPENDLSFESKIFNFKLLDSTSFLVFQPLLWHNISNEMYNSFINNISKIFNENMEDLMVIKWTDRFFEILINNIFEKYKTILNIFSLLFSPYAIIKENILKNTNYFFDNNNGIYLNKNILGRFACMHIVKNFLSKSESDYEKINSFNITYCNITFNEDFEVYLQNNQTEIDLFERKKVKVDYAKYDIEYTYFNYLDNGSRIDEERKINFDLSKSKNKDNDKYLNSFKIFQGIYPSNFINNIFSPFSYSSIIFINFYFDELYYNYLDRETVVDVCNTFFLKIMALSYTGVWIIVFFIILIIVLKISHSISDPIDKLIQPVPVNDNSSKELNKYFKNISYEDDSTINDLFILCKKLILGGFKSEEDYKQKKKTKKMNSYNNISLVKSNNMIINETELLKGEQEQENNFSEDPGLLNYKNKFISNIANHSINEMKKLNFKVLSNSKVFGKFYQNNKKYLIKDKECFDILNNEIISQKKKQPDENKSKGTKFNFLKLLSKKIDES